MPTNLFKNRKGSALLVALLVMGVLMAISLAVSTLVLRETQVTRSLIDSGQAYYAAESGVELALYGLNHNLPGWQPTDDDGYEVAEISDFAVAEYRVNNRCKAFPCFDGDFDIAGNPPPAKEFYYELDLNETLTIPLFIAQDGGGRSDVGNFTVEFWSPLNPRVHLNLHGEEGALSSWDVLRWKVLGIEEGTNEPEAISDFTALSQFNDGTATSADSPSWFGTVNCNEYDGDARYSNEIDCVGYGGGAEIAPVSEDQVAVDVTGSCDNTQAREYYDYSGEGAARSVAVENITPCYSIKTFLDDHFLNYLTLTNFMNPAVILAGNDREALSKLFVRVELFPSDEDGRGSETVREFSHIKANGYSGDSKRTLDVRLQKGSFMPVFNFSLYSTYKAEGSDYYGGVDNEEGE